MEKKYRITFHDGPMGNRYKDVDVLAKDFDDVFRLAYQMPEAKNRLYSDVTVSEIPKEPSVIGIEFSYRDTVFKKNYTGYVFIKANDEAEAVRYYNEHFLGGRFWFSEGKTEEDGKCVRGKVLRTYYADGWRYDADATMPKCGVVADLLAEAAAKCEALNHETQGKEKFCLGKG